MKTKNLITISFVLISNFVFSQANKYDIYSILIFHLGKYIEWNDNKDYFTIGVVKNPNMKDKVDKSASLKNINGKKIISKSIL